MKQNIFAALVFAPACFAAPLVALAQVQPTPTPTPTTPAPAPSQAPSSAVDMAVTQPIVDTVDRVVAVVGPSVITWSDLVAAVNQKRAQGLKMPSDPAGQNAIAKQTLSDLVDEELLVQKAADLKIEVTDQDVATEVDRQVKEVRKNFASEAEYKSELKNAGFGTPEEYRRTLTEQLHRQMLIPRVLREVTKTAKPGSVTEEEVTKTYDSYKDELRKRPVMLAFRQVVVAPHASKAADSAARAKAESILAKLKAGANFDSLAKLESMDPGSAKLGGDLGWNRRGSGFVPEFEAAMFSLLPGQLSPLVKTSFGYHIIRVDRVQPAEVKVRHILISPVTDSNDVRAAMLRADTVAEQWRKGANFDSLVAKYHDQVEFKGVLEPDSLGAFPPAYQKVLAETKLNEVSAPFPLVSQGALPKYAVVRVIARTEAGEYSEAEVRDNIRRRLAQIRQTRDLLDDLRRQTYVSFRM